MSSLLEKEKDLYSAILTLKTQEDCAAFFRDLCTPSEIRSMRERWLVAQLLYKGDMSYRQIHEETKVSIATITRVARFLFHEDYSGYRLLLKAISERGLNK
ncbi:Helix-turn-helix transcriptional regulator [Candidatus Cyrtobacter comes]|uniref:Helix-turn-helix transcriptional regulator n=1 Tax=Candidatus Cyrtobacter comes TaxID=675776 RepID=A0ABU5L8F0_9RICK|nr:Helix-turn-helix transcriptional regulator [Candidatus Cyrtobacter comes]